MTKSIVHSLRILLLSAVIIVPFSASATSTKQVSQDFGSSVTYFPQKEDNGVLFSDGSFFRSAQPSVAVDWERVFITADRDESFMPRLAISFKKYDYVISGSTVTTNADVSVDNNEVLRMERANPENLRTVFTLPESSQGVDQLRDIVAFKNKLFLSDSEGLLWRSTNGTDWNVTPTEGLPTDVDLSDLYASESVLYGVSGNTVYQSKNGRVWTELAGEYQDYTYGGSVAIVTVADTLYLYTYTTNDYKGRMWTYNKKKDTFTSIYRSSTDNHYRLFTHRTSLYLTEYNEEADMFIVWKWNNERFVKEYSDYGMVQELISVENRILFMVLNENGTHLLRYGR